MHTSYQKRWQQLQTLADEVQVDCVLLYGNRVDSRYSVWACGLPCRSAQHYLTLNDGSPAFIEISYRAAELREASGLTVIEVAEENLFGHYFLSSLKDTKRLGIAGNAPANHFLGLKAELVDLTERVDQLLSVKSEQEITLIGEFARNIDALVSSAWKTLTATQPFTEIMLRNDILKRIVVSADQSAFPISVVSGERLKVSTIGTPTDNLITADSSCLIDVGTVTNGLYCDITRMFWLSPSPLSRAYDTLKNILLESVQDIHPDMTVGEYIDTLRKQLTRNKLPARTLELADLGHGIGFGLHEAPFIGYPHWDSTHFQPGMIICIEPEIFVDGFRLRHEEMVAVTETGAKIISI